MERDSDIRVVVTLSFKYIYMSYKTTRVSKALLVMVAFLLPVHIFLIKLTVSTLFIPEIHISKKNMDFVRKNSGKSVDK